MLDWAEKYRPKSLNDVVGNASAVQELRNWAEKWSDGGVKKRGVVLIGPPGVGKTTVAHALANDFRWGVIELNASDTRNYERIKKVAMYGAVYDTFTDSGEFISAKEGGRKLIILDEADNLFGNEDRGGMQAIVETLRVARQPILLIVNDYYELTRKSAAIKVLCAEIKFMRIHKDTIKALLRDICINEKADVMPAALEDIASRANGDLRSAINDLQSVCEGNKMVTPEQVSVLGYRDKRGTIFTALAEIFKTTNINKAREAVRDLDEEPEYILLWIDENLPLEYKDPEDLSNAYEKISRADIFLGRVLRRQYYGLWAYANDLMTCGTAIAKRTPYKGFVKFQFPAWLSKMARSKSSRAVQDALLGKIAFHCHTSKATARNDILYSFKYMFKNEEYFAASMVYKLSLEEEEIAYLLDEKIDSPKLKRLLEDVQRHFGTEKKFSERLNENSFQL